MFLIVSVTLELYMHILTYIYINGVLFNQFWYISDIHTDIFVNCPAVNT